MDNLEFTAGPSALLQGITENTALGDGWETFDGCAVKHQGKNRFSFLKLEALQEEKGPSLVLTGDTIDLSRYGQLQELSGKAGKELAYSIFRRFQEDHPWTGHGFAAKAASLETMHGLLHAVTGPGFEIPEP